MPYAKWREALFRTLPTADALTAHFEAALADVGSVEQWVDLDEVLAKPELRATALATYRGWLTRLGESYLDR
jgi:hypothetical protein